jgi:two-component system, NarL family, response regulator DevR
MGRIRLLIVDSHELVRAGLRAVLASDPNLEVVAEAATGAHAVALAREHRPDVVLLEARLPDEDGAQTCRLLHTLTPRPALAILTDQADDLSVRACVRAGAQGYLLKQVSADDLRRAVRALACGEGVIDPRIAPLVLSAVRQAEANRPLDITLGGRRRTILRLVAEGCSNREIAAQTQLSELTIKGYVEEILATLGARNRVHAAVLATRRGLI